MSGQAVTRLLAGLALLCLVAIVALWSAGVQAEEGPQCGPREDMLKQLKGKFHEEVTWFGLIDGQTMELLTMSPERTWTRIRVVASGMACIVSAGEDGQYDTAAFDKAKKGEEM